MFRIFTSNRKASFLLFDRSAVALVTALLQDDLDDRVDGLRRVLETDPLLATWAITESDRHGVRLTSTQSACRWVSEYFLVAGSPEDLVEPTKDAGNALQVWRSIVGTSVSAARHARELARRHSASDDAYWYALLCCCKQQMDGLAEMNGHSPLPGVEWAVPGWLTELESHVAQATQSFDAASVTRQAMQTTSSTDQRWLERDELDGWFAPLPHAKQLVPALLQKMHRLRQLETNFAETLHREKMASMQQLAYGASHEINNPLANISTRAQSLMHNEHDPERRRKLLAINQQAFRAYEMIADMMLFAKPPKLEIQTVHLHALVRQIRDELEASSDQVLCRIVAQDESIAVDGDATHLGVAIKAICQNGLEAMGGGGELLVELSTTRSGDAEIAIQDSGVGLNEHSRRHLFDPFFSGREAGRGMGFGLSKAWRIVEQHHGRIRVSSVPERGSCFTITLPLKSDDALI